MLASDSYNNEGNCDSATKHPTKEQSEGEETSVQSRSASWARLNVSNWPPFSSSQDKLSIAIYLNIELAKPNT
jgi:hypothetical protein